MLAFYILALGMVHGKNNFFDINSAKLAETVDLVWGYVLCGSNFPKYERKRPSSQ